MTNEISETDHTDSSRESLEAALSDAFELSLAEIPQALRKRIVEELLPAPWDQLSPFQRRSLAIQADNKHDPEYQREAKHWDAFFDRKDKLLERIDELVSIGTPTALDIQKRDEMLGELRTELAEMEFEERNTAGECAADEEKNAGPPIGSPGWRSRNAKAAAEVRHSQKGGSRNKQQAIREIWLTGQYKTRDECAEKACKGLSIAFSTARKALRNTPDPHRD